MTYREFNEAVKSAIENTSVELGEVVGVRFDDVKREIGDICNNSRHNADREDERDFPEYGSDEYDDMDELDGTSAWKPTINIKQTWKSLDDNLSVMYSHCYIVVGDKERHPDPDVDEILISNARVVAEIF